MRNIALTLGIVAALALPAASQTQKTDGSKPSASPQEPVRYPASPFTGTVFMLQAPEKPTQNTPGAEGPSIAPYPGSLIGLIGPGQIITSPLTGSVLSPIIGPSGLIEPGMTAQPGTTGEVQAPSRAAQPQGPIGMQMLAPTIISVPMLTVQQLTVPILTVGYTGQGAIYGPGSVGGVTRAAPRAASRPAPARSRR